MVRTPYQDRSWVHPDIGGVNRGRKTKDSLRELSRKYRNRHSTMLDNGACRNLQRGPHREDTKGGIKTLWQGKLRPVEGPPPIVSCHAALGIEGENKGSLTAGKAKDKRAW